MSKSAEWTKKMIETKIVRAKPRETDRNYKTWEETLILMTITRWKRRAFERKEMRLGYTRLVA